MARIFGTVLILAGCAGFLYKWAEGEKARQRMAGEWIRLFVRWGYALEQEHVRLYDFLSFYETADASMQAFLDEVCICMRNHQNPSGQKIWQDCLQKHKRELQIGQEGWEILTSAAGAFYGESSAENLRCNEICRKRMEKFLAESRLEFFKKQRVYLPVGMLTGVVMIILLV